MERRHVIILGGGIGGLLVARHLATAARRGECAVTLVDSRRHLTFAPMLPAVATGRLAPETAEVDLQEACDRVGVNFLQGDVLRIDAPARRVLLRGEVHRAYDRLVCAFGAARGGLPGAWVPTTAAEAARLRDALVAPTRDGRARDVLVIGDGIAAVAMARAIAVHLAGRVANVHWVATHPRMLRLEDDQGRGDAQALLAQVGVHVHRQLPGTGGAHGDLDLHDPVVIDLTRGRPWSPEAGWPWPTDAAGALLATPAGEVLGAEDVWSLAPAPAVDDLLPCARALARNVRRTLLATGAERGGSPLPAPRHGRIGGGLTLPVLLGLAGYRRAVEVLLRA